MDKRPFHSIDTSHARRRSWLCMVASLGVIFGLLSAGTPSGPLPCYSSSRYQPMEVYSRSTRQPRASSEMPKKKKASSKGPSSSSWEPAVRAVEEKFQNRLDKLCAQNDELVAQNAALVSECQDLRDEMREIKQLLQGLQQPSVASIPTISPLVAGGTSKIDWRSVKRSIMLVVAEAGTGRSTGSGFVWGSDENGACIIVTNYHVIQAALTGREGERGTIRVAGPSSVGERKFHNATFVGAEPNTDIAVVRVTDSWLSKTARPLPVGTSGTLRQTNEVFAIGYPLLTPRELQKSSEAVVTSGIVSILRRSRRTCTGFPCDFIQTDAAINGGNSGGPLLNADGEVVGIVTQGIQNAENTNFALPIDDVNGHIQGILSRGSSPLRAVTGVKFWEEPVITQAHGKLQVLAFQPESPGWEAGLRPGDIVTHINGVEMTDVKGAYAPEQLAADKANAMISQMKPNDTIVIKVNRTLTRELFSAIVQSMDAVHALDDDFPISMLLDLKPWELWNIADPKKSWDAILTVLGFTDLGEGVTKNIQVTKDQIVGRAKDCYRQSEVEEVHVKLAPLDLHANLGMQNAGLRSSCSRR
eukprot:TRINITY_DN80523_c0_g1_i1.p1 TRINITY_DN80523_c0_g1~~TRINITY_DN80523_c0_g1_i1.p1  ORF type:complete len:586 (+),score=51.94 TRINITY_DN80523_c0_g1_i1:85-1842(+)